MRALYFGAVASLIALILLCLCWELFLAPLRPGGSWLALKALPLLAPLPGVLNARRYTFQWAPMLLLLYFTEGVVRAFSGTGPARLLAGLEVVLAVVFFVCSVLLARGLAARAVK